LVIQLCIADKPNKLTDYEGYLKKGIFSLFIISLYYSYWRGSCFFGCISMPTIKVVLLLSIY